MRSVCLAALALAACAAAQTPGSSSKSAAFDPRADPGIDPTIDPCVDFYQYACHTWNATHPIPADQSRWGRFEELQERTRETLRHILEKASNADIQRDAVDREIGDYYAACMDDNAANAQGVDPIRGELDHVAALRNKAELTDEFVRLHRLGIDILFHFGSQVDRHDSTHSIAMVSEAGLSLPDRDYYLKTDPRSVQLREQFLAHVEAMFRLLGESSSKSVGKSSEGPEAEARTVLSIETELAKATLDRVERRNPERTYNKLTVHELVSLDPGIDWPHYFEGLAAPAFATLNVTYPPYFRQMESLLVQQSLDDWKTYLTWQILNNSAELLSAPFVSEQFRFNGGILKGLREQPARWKSCVTLVDKQMGDALGQKFVELTFGTQGKQRTLEMVKELEAALAHDIETLDWMTPPTRKQALAKLREISNKIGYPDHWRDYSTVAISRTGALGNYERLNGFEQAHDLAKIGKPVDHSEMKMTAPTVNASYNGAENVITFPAGILQPPFYDNRAGDAANFGGIGAVIGHELTHGFDDQGRKFDGQGNLRDWWTPEDAQEFEKRVSCIADEYSQFSPVEGAHLNGRLTLGENTADNGGVRLAFMALLQRLAQHPERTTGGFTPEQRFFLSYAHLWCQNITEQAARLRVNTDPHSPGQFRVNGVVSNMPEFEKAFSCHSGQPMVRGPACHVW